MKKYLSLLLACVLALALLCACGKKDAAEQTPAPETGDTQWQPLEMPEEMRETCLYSLFDVAAAET